MNVFEYLLRSDFAAKSADAFSCSFHLSFSLSPSQVILLFYCLVFLSFPYFFFQSTCGIHSASLSLMTFQRGIVILRDISNFCVLLKLVSSADVTTSTLVNDEPHLLLGILVKIECYLELI